MRIASKTGGQWVIETDPVYGREWIATHTERERGDVPRGEGVPDVAGGPEYVCAPTLEQLYIECEAADDMYADAAHVEGK